MKIYILMGSPRKDGNTAALVNPFTDELKSAGHEVEMVWLYDKDIKPCMACRACQKDWKVFGCARQDDAQDIFDKILEADLLVFATPIYCWYCTAPMKALMDRLVYGMNKYYDDKMGPALWAGKAVASITTCGYRPEKGADLWEDGLKRYCKHSGLRYLGQLAERHLGYHTIFMDADKEQHARAFAQEMMEAL
ncbi:MAG: flavodoxin family protein [Lachnospiraceae bacterium]|nr:flavodoxin family protein [Lachnospiraceae bacterium]